MVVIGAGAAGLMAAWTAASRGRRTMLLEHTDAIGAKILISGGGRCNFTNVHVAPERFLSDNPHFARSALARYTAQDFIALVEAHGIPYYEKTLGQLFCEGAGAARRIVAMLAGLARGAGVEIRTGAAVTGITRGDCGFELATAQGPLTAASVVVATGGLSIPKLGATDFAYRIAGQFGLPIVAPRPGLVPLTFAAADLARFGGLAGVSFDAIVQPERGPAFREAALITHRGLSGPAVLQASSYWAQGEAVRLRLLPDRDAAAWLLDAKRQRPKASLAGALAEALPARLAAAFAGEDPRPLADRRDRELEATADALARWSVRPAGTEGYLKAEVTVGGIDTRALDQKTMAARAAPGLFFVGEAVDVTGWLGGYNFQWAWSSGWAAGMAA